MKCTVEIIIDLPRQRVVELYCCPDNLQLWWDDLISFEHVGGEHGEIGARYTQCFHANGKKMKSTQTILEIDLPRTLRQAQEFEAPILLSAIITDRFEETDGQRTRWSTIHEFSGQHAAAMEAADTQAYLLAHKKRFKRFAMSRGKEE